jgi:hypothetical protein
MLRSTAFQPSITTEKTAVIWEQLQGYLEKDAWNVTDQFFEAYGGGDSWSHSQKKLTFTLFPTNIRHEIKFFFANQLVNESLSLYTMVKYSSSFRHLTSFLVKFYPRIESLVDIPHSHVLMKYKTFLTNTGIRVSYNSVGVPTLLLLSIQYTIFYLSSMIRGMKWKKMFGM